MFRRIILLGMTLASALAIGTAQAKTIRIAEHRQARIDALKTVVPDIEKKYNVQDRSHRISRPRERLLNKASNRTSCGQCSRHL